MTAPVRRSGSGGPARYGVPLAGIAIVAAHLAGFAALAQRSAGTELAVELDVPLAAPRLALDGKVSIADGVTTSIDREGAGLRRKRWRVTYRGDFAREVGATQLVGPFQDPAKPACSGRVVVGQALLDDGRASPGTIAAATRVLVDRELRGETIFPIGAYQRVDKLALTWARLETRWFDRALVGDAPHGYVRATATLVFERAAVPIVIALVPEMTQMGLHFRIATHADLAFDNRVVQWASDKLGADGLASRLARRQLDEALVTTLAPPAPFELPEGTQLVFEYCDGPIEIVDGAWGALPFAVGFTPLANAPTILPPHLQGGPRVAPTAATTLAIDLDLDALNALLFELWRGGVLDRKLGEAGLDRHFNADPTVIEYLSIRLSPVRLALPPVVEPGPHGLRLAADARVAIGDPTDARTVTTGRVYGAVDFHVGSGLRIDVDLGALELACERWPTVLVPCYADLVAALADRGADFHGVLTEKLGKLLEAIFVERHVSTGQLPGQLAIRGVVPSIAPGAHGLHLELDAHLIETR